MQQIEPTDTGLLIWPQRRLERWPGSMRASPSGLRRPLRVSASQGPALTVDQSGSDWSPDSSSSTATPATSRMASANGSPPAAAAASTLRNFSRSCVELRPIHLDPASAQKLKAVGPFEEGADFARREALLTERQFHVKIEQCILAEDRRHPAADCRPDLRAKRSARAPRARRAHHNPGGLELRHIRQELKCFGRGPPEWMIELPGFHHGLQPCALLSRLPAPALEARADALCSSRPRTPAAPRRAAGAVREIEPRDASCRSQ